jgi:hypothetical protein
MSQMLFCIIIVVYCFCLLPATVKVNLQGLLNQFDLSTVETVVSLAPKSKP